MKEGVTEGSTYSIDIPRASLPLSSTVSAVRNAGKGALDIARQRGRLGKVELVPVPVGVGATGVARLGAAGDGQVAAAGALEGDGAGDGGGVDLLEGGAGGRVAVAAAAAGSVGDAGGLEAGDGCGVGELLGLGACEGGG